jgi:GTP cyclohydrolase II
MVQYFEVSSIELLSNNPDKSRALTRLGIVVDMATPLEIASNPANEDYLATKKHRLGHHLSLVAYTQCAEGGSLRILATFLAPVSSRL